MSSNTRFRSCRARRTPGSGRGPIVPAHGPDTPEARRGHLAVEEPDGLGHGIRRGDAADDGIGTAPGRSPLVEFDGLLDRVPTGGGGHVDELLDVPSRGLGPVRVHVEATVHPRHVGGVGGLGMGQVRVPVGPGGVPQVYVGIDDAGGSVGHLRGPSDGWPVVPTNSRSVPSSQGGTAGPPKVTLPIGRGWLRSPSQPSPITSSAPASATASGWVSRWSTSSPDGLSGDLLGGLDPHGEGRDPPLGRPGGHAARAGPRPGHDCARPTWWRR